jgi:hypothetical protein
MDAFGQRARARAGRLFAALLRLLGDRNEAEDVGQEVLLRAWPGVGSATFGPLHVISLALQDRGQRTRPLSADERPPGRERAIGADMLQVSASTNDELSTTSNSWSCGALSTSPCVTCRMAIALRDVAGLCPRAAETFGINEAAFKAACTWRA